MAASALQLGKSGLLTQQKSLDIIGANIANVSTSGFQSSRMEFSSLLSKTLSSGTGSNGVRGGTNPIQIGLGVQVAGVSKSFNQGRLSQTGERTDLGIDGKGFFPVSARNEDGSIPENEEWFLTRDGSMTLGMVANQDNTFTQALLHKATGLPLLGIPGDPLTGEVADGDINGIYQPGDLDIIEIPVDSTFPPEATTSIVLTGNLNATGILSDQPAVQNSEFFLSDGTPVIASTDLNDVYEQAGSKLFETLAASPEITFNVEIGGKPFNRTFTYGVDGNTVAELGAFFENSFLNTDAVPVTGLPPASVAFVNNQLVFTSNLGAKSDFTNIEMKQANRTLTPFTKTQSAVGESTRFAATAFDSLGAKQTFDIVMTKVDTTTNSGQTWRWYANSNTDSSGQLPVGTGIITFDSSGQYVSTAGNSIQINLDNGATDPLVMNIDFSTLSNLADPIGSDATVRETNGFGAGEMENWSVEGDGSVVGYYTNGKTREFGRIPVLTMTNRDGLLAKGNNLYQQGLNTGDLVVRTAGTSIAGRLRQFVLEDSNVDLAVSMTKMIEAQRAFSSSSKVIQTDQEIISIALDLKR